MRRDLSKGLMRIGEGKKKYDKKKKNKGHTLIRWKKNGEKGNKIKRKKRKF